MGERIRAAREAAGMTQAELARRVGEKQQSVARWENGQSKTNPDQLVALVRELGVSADHLLGLADEPPPVSVERALGQEQRLDPESRKRLQRAYRASLDLPGASS